MQLSAHIPAIAGKPWWATESSKKKGFEISKDSTIFWSPEWLYQVWSKNLSSSVFFLQQKNHYEQWSPVAAYMVIFIFAKSGGAAGEFPRLLC